MIEGDVTIIVQAAESFNVAAIIAAKNEAEAAAAASAASETAAAGSATSATASAASASGSASAAAGSESAAAASETAAATSETNAATSAGEAAASAASIDPATLLTKADNLASVANAATARTNLGLAIGTNVQAWDADLDAVASLAADGIIERTGAGTAAIITKPAGALVGTTDTQTLSGKTLTGPVINETVTGTALAGQAAAEAGTGTGLMTSTRTAQAIAAQVPALIPDVGTSEVLAATAGASFGAVGTYAFLYNGSNNPVFEGNTYAGSGLFPAGLTVDGQAISADASRAIDATRGSSSMSGTWRAMGRVNGPNAGAASDTRITMYLRIS